VAAEVVLRVQVEQRARGAGGCREVYGVYKKEERIVCYGEVV